MPEYPKLTSRKIKYNSPSGFVHIGKYTPPFEKNDTGFGFKGVLVEDFKSGKLQCSICGEWFEQLHVHLNFIHNINGSDYKKQFGLLQSTALKSKKMRLKQSEVMIAMRKSHKKHRMKFEKNNLFASNRKNKPKAEESKNKYGVCDLQIMAKVTELRNELGRTPTLIDLKERYGGGFIHHLHKRYRSYVTYCKENGFDPNFSNYNPKYSREYFIKKAQDKQPSIRIFTINEVRALYRYFPNGIKELKEELKKVELIAQ